MSATPSSPDDPDVFTEVFKLLTPERMLHHPRATGFVEVGEFAHRSRFYRIEKGSIIQ